MRVDFLHGVSKLVKAGRLLALLDIVAASVGLLRPASAKVVCAMRDAAVDVCGVAALLNALPIALSAGVLRPAIAKVVIACGSSQSRAAWSRAGKSEQHAQKYWG